MSSRECRSRANAPDRFRSLAGTGRKAAPPDRSTAHLAACISPVDTSTPMSSEALAAQVRTTTSRTLAIVVAAHASSSVAARSVETQFSAGRIRSSSRDGRFTVAMVVAHKSPPFQDGRNCQRSPRRTASTPMRWMPGAIGIAPALVSPSIVVTAAMSAVVSICKTPARRTFRNPPIVIRVVAPGGRSSGPGQLSLAGGRLKNHTGNSWKSRYDLVMIAEHAGSASRQLARRSQACGAPVWLSVYGSAGSNRTHQPSWTNTLAETPFQASSATNADPRELRRQEAAMKPPQGRKHSADENGFGEPIEWDAVQRPAQAVGPQQARGRKEPPHPRHPRAIVA